ncbi:hypothetical protein [Tautonia sociabilis]|uniref:hypothetical protein n=1 Tax=Tautonia sociabilis TaxID=2080755 RepID=UPI0013151553|nr:hypothetical protein [Tautonia sociabilis]
MTTRRVRSRVLLCFVGLLVPAVLSAAMAGGPAREAREGGEAEGDPAVERARREVRMLDTLYKTAVVSVTDTYRRGQPAIMVAKDVFKAMDEGGFHSARLVDASMAPLGVDNDPKTDFERRAAEAMRRGETYLDEVVGEGEGRRLLAATVVPAVHPRCAECHGVEEGDLLGFIRYEVPIR